MSKTKKRRRRPRPAAKPVQAESESAEPTTAGSRPLVTNAAVFALLGVLVGSGIGWYLRDARAGTDETQASAAPAASGSGSPCETWSGNVCGELGDTSGDCQHVKGAAEVMPESACVAALSEVASTVEKLKAGRKVCTDLATQLCKDVGKSSPATCDMIKKRMEAMPVVACQERQKNYPKLLNQLKQMTNPARRGSPGAPPGMPRRPGGPGGPGGPGAKRPGAPAGHGHGHSHGDGHAHGPGDGHGH